MIKFRFLTGHFKFVGSYVLYFIAKQRSGRNKQFLFPEAGQFKKGKLHSADVFLTLYS